MKKYMVKRIIRSVDKTSGGAYKIGIAASNRFSVDEVSELAREIDPMTVAG
jgi:hypothetical protein